MPTAPEPIRIGYCLSLTGPVAGNSLSARHAHDIWREDVNSRGGLLGRPVELVCYDDQADASLVPGIYERLMEADVEMPFAPCTLWAAHIRQSANDPKTGLCQRAPCIAISS